MAEKRPVSDEEVEKQAARPLPYFSHDSDAASDIKVRRLLKRCGFEGYGRWWRLCELMAQTDGHAVPVSTEEDAEILADELGFDATFDLMAWLNLVEDVGLIDGDRLGEGEVWSVRMGKNAEFVGRQRAAGKRNGKLGGRPKGSTKEKLGK
jgi:hypothetical protein